MINAAATTLLTYPDTILEFGSSLVEPQCVFDVQFLQLYSVV